MPAHLAAATAALGAAFFYGASNVLQQRKASGAPPEMSMRISLLWYLARHPIWWLGIASDLTGFLCQVLALALGSLVLVQPLLVMSLLFALTLGARFGTHRLTRADVTSAVVLVGSVSLFLLVAAPEGGVDQRAPADWILPGSVMAGLVLGCLLFAGRFPGALRSALLGAAAGLTFAVSSTLMKSFAHLLTDEGLPGTLRHWEPYALGGVVAAGFLMVQSSFQAADLRAALPALEVTEPIFACLLGVTLMEEQIHADGTVAKVVVVGAIVAAVWSAVSLARSTARDEMAAAGQGEARIAAG